MFKVIDENLLLFSSKFAKQKEYWENKLSGSLTKTEIPLKDKGRDHNVEMEWKKTGIRIPDPLALQLSNLCKNSVLSLYMILLTTLKVLIFKYIDNKDPIIISPVYKPKVTADTINNYVFIRDSINCSITFKELLIKVRQSTLEAYDNQDYPSAKLINHLFHEQENSDHGIISDILCLLENIHNQKSCEDLKKALVFSFSFEEEGHRLKGNILYNPAECESSYIKQMAPHFTKILESGMADINKSLSSITFLSEGEKRQLLFEFNNNSYQYKYEAGSLPDKENRTIHRLFEEQAARIPDHIAIIGIGQRAKDSGNTSEQLEITYKELNERSNQMAHLLKQKGALADTIVALLVGRSVEMIIGIMSILKTGGAYLPLDPEYPKERINYMLKDSNAKVLVSEVSKVNGWDGEILNIHTLAASQPPLSRGNLLNSQECPTWRGGKSAGWISSANLAYIIYTSGTTGKPKGVMIEHRSVTNLVLGLKSRIYGQYKDGLKICMLSPYSFDASVKQLFGALLLGYSLYIVPETVRVDALGLLNFYRKYRIEVSDGTPTHIKLLLEVLKENKHRWELHVKHFIIGGEALSQKVVEEFYKQIKSLNNQNKLPKITNVYGPTECCVDTTSYEVFEKNVQLFNYIPLGRPIPNYQVYILDREKELLPIGAIGELWVSGTGVARGYLNSQFLSKNKFIDNPFINDEKMYYTGDLARWMPDGNIIFLGRLDQQVKVRGFRIELDEIDTLLLSHEMVKETVVTVREEIGGDKYLCAYIVPYSPGSFDTHQLREHLSGKLPDYVIPAHFVEIEEIPITPNGKIDRKALPAPMIKRSDTYIAPKDKIESKLVEIWAKVLNRDAVHTSQIESHALIGIDDNFFEMGGHSLKATTIVSRIYKELNVELPLAEVFRTPTVRGLAQIIKTAMKVRYVSIEPVEEKEYYVLSSAQKRLYILQQMKCESKAYNMPYIIPLTNKFDLEKLEKAFLGLIKRHESLRTSFVMVNEIEEPVQRVHKQGEVEFSIDYYQAIEDPVEEVIENIIKPFDLSKAPLLRVGFIEIEKGEKHTYFLLVDMHHIITDGTSQPILKKEFMSLINEEKQTPLRLQYKDFSQWQNDELKKDKFKQQEKYWLKEFAGEIPVLDFPTDYVRQEAHTFEGGVINHVLGKADTEELNKLALQEGATQYMVLLTIFYILILKITSQEDIIVGTPATGRRHADLEQIIGIFINTLALRNYPKGEKTFSKFLREVKERTIKAFENQDYPFENLVERVVSKRDMSRNPLFDVMFDFLFADLYKKVITEEIVPGLKIEPYQYENRTSKFDFIFMTGKKDGRIYLSVEYSSELYKKETMGNWLKYFEKIVKIVIKDNQIKLRDIELIDEGETDEIHSSIQKDIEEINMNRSIDFDI